MLLAVVALIAGGSCGGEPARQPSSAPGDGSAINEVERDLRDRITLLSEGTVTGVISLVRVGDETRVVTVGLADAAAKEPLQRENTFPIASVTKPMVATAVLQQVEAGKLTLDDTVEQWLPRTVTKGDRMTIRQLLSHRSGVHEPQSLEEWSQLAALTDRDIVKILGAKPLDFEPGTSARYSNVGYVLLGMILEKVTGASIGTVLDSRIFDLAEMDDSALAPTQWDVRGYVDGKDVTADTGLNVLQAAGSVVSTAEDVDRFFHSSVGREAAITGPGRADEQTPRRHSTVRWRIRAGNLDGNIQLRYRTGSLRRPARLRRQGVDFPGIETVCCRRGQRGRPSRARDR